MYYLIAMNWNLLFNKYNINMLLFLNNFLLYSLNTIDWIIIMGNIVNFYYIKIHIYLNLKFSNYKMKNLSCSSKHM